MKPQLPKFKFKIAIFSVTLVLKSQLLLAAESEPYFYGTATINETGTICLKMLSQEPGQPVAHGYVCYDKSNPNYSKIKEHIGPIKVGETKTIEPFPSN